MSLIRVYSQMDDKFKVAIPRGIRKALNIKPGEKLELTIGEINKAKRLVVSKVNRR